MIPKTIENTREPDETVCRPDDEEVCLVFIKSYLNSILLCVVDNLVKLNFFAVVC